MRNSESTMYLVPCDTCGHSMGAHNGACRIMTCHCEGARLYDHSARLVERKRDAKGHFVKVPKYQGPIYHDERDNHA